MPPFVPPTPTHLPPAPLAPVHISANSWRIWAFTDDAIMVWQQIGPNKTQVIQIAIIVVIVIGFAMFAIRKIQALTTTTGDG